MAPHPPSAVTMRQRLGQLATGQLAYTRPSLEERDVNRVCYLVVSTDRGLCGCLNINLFKNLLPYMNACSDTCVQCALAMIVSTAVSFFTSVGRTVVPLVTVMGDTPSLSDSLRPV